MAYWLAAAAGMIPGTYSVPPPMVSVCAIASRLVDTVPLALVEL